MPPANVTLESGVGTSDFSRQWTSHNTQGVAQVASLPPVGIFGGGFNQLVLRYEAGALKPVNAILVQDLRGNESRDALGDGVSIDGDAITVTGSLIQRAGLETRSATDDVSEPALLLLPIAR